MTIPSTEELKERMEKVQEKVEKAAEETGRKIEDIKIIPVSKTHPLQYIKNAISAGIDVFGENYAQELRDKHDEMETINLQQPEWHFIGGLQKSNVKYITPFVNLIHSIDSEKLLNEANKRAINSERNIDILLQVNTSGESAKSGCEPDEIVELAGTVHEYSNLRLKGLMTIGTFTDDDEIRIREFSLLRNLLNKVNTELNLNLKELSMGMTADYPLAIKEGATMVRVGTAIFGARDYSK